MFARKLSTGVAAVAMTLGALSLAGPASATTSNPQPDDTTSTTPTLANLVGVGSDTSQGVVNAVADAYNATTATPKIYSYAACATPTTCGTITLPTADINRPNGSGAGKGLLYGAAPSGAPGNGTNGDTDIDFARSSSALSTTEANNNLTAFPFAVDTLIMVTSANVASHAPASLTIQQILSIYKGDITNWSQLGGAPGTIKPLIPQSGSGTRSFFISQLTAANGGATVNLASSVTEVQEHDPGPIQNDPDAVAPFSLAKSLPYASNLRSESGFSADRAIYNVVRTSDAASPAFLNVFGSDGFFCSDAAKSAIVNAGFRQLLRPADGGACGQANPTANPTSNLAAGSVATSTAVAATSASASSARIVATVSSSPAPKGTVSFYEGGTLLKSGVRLTSNQATLVQPAAAGAHTYTAVFTPIEHTAYVGSQGSGSVTVGGTASTPTPTPVVKKAKAKLREAFKPRYAVGAKVVGKVTVGLAGTSKKSSGSVKVLLGKKVVGKGKLKSSKALIVLRHLKPGKNKLTLVWGGNKFGAAGKKSFIITIVK